MICGECMHCDMAYANYEWKVKGCRKGHENIDWDTYGCAEFTIALLDDDESREKCLNCPKAECNDCIGHVSKFRGWTQIEDEFLIANQDKPRPWLAEALGRPLNAISKRKKELGIIKHPKVRFTPEDDEFIRTHTISESVKALGRQWCSVSMRLQILKRKDKENGKE